MRVEAEYDIHSCAGFPPARLLRKSSFIYARIPSPESNPLMGSVFSYAIPSDTVMSKIAGGEDAVRTLKVLLMLLILLISATMILSEQPSFQFLHPAR